MKGKTFFLSFVEECVMDPAYFAYVGGRIEVFEIGSEQYAIEEIRFFTKKQKEFYRLREKWDFEEVTAKELERLRKKIIVLNDKEKE
jgi:hypothetical protein